MTKLPKGVLKFFQECGRRGGEQTSARKKAAVRLNGTKGGRPRLIELNLARETKHK